jgi:hypothetical protein
MRESKQYIEENGEVLEKIPREEMRRIEKEEKQIRLEIEERKKRMYGKAGKKRLSENEENKSLEEKPKKIELAEVKHNLGSKYRHTGKAAQVPTKSGIVPEGRKVESHYPHSG